LKADGGGKCEQGKCGEEGIHPKPSEKSLGGQLAVGREWSPGTIKGRPTFKTGRITKKKERRYTAEEKDNRGRSERGGTQSKVVRGRGWSEQKRISNSLKAIKSDQKKN